MKTQRQQISQQQAPMMTPPTQRVQQVQGPARLEASAETEAETPMLDAAATAQASAPPSGEDEASGDAPDRSAELDNLRIYLRSLEGEITAHELLIESTDRVIEVHLERIRALDGQIAAEEAFLASKGRGARPPAPPPPPAFPPGFEDDDLYEDREEGLHEEPDLEGSGAATETRPTTPRSTWVPPGFEDDELEEREEGVHEEPDVDLGGLIAQRDGALMQVDVNRQTLEHAEAALAARLKEREAVKAEIESLSR